MSAILDFPKNFILPQTAANILEISIKHVFAASNRNIIKNRVKNKKLRQFFQKITVFLFKTNLHI